VVDIRVIVDNTVHLRKKRGREGGRGGGREGGGLARAGPGLLVDAFL
jgi:hypothetical protein